MVGFSAIHRLDVVTVVANWNTPHDVHVCIEKVTATHDTLVLLHVVLNLVLIPGPKNTMKSHTRYSTFPYYILLEI